MGVRHALQTRRRGQVCPLQPRGTGAVPRRAPRDGRHRDRRPALLERGALSPPSSGVFQGVLTSRVLRSRTATLRRPFARSSSPTANSSSSLRLPSRPSCPKSTRNRRSGLCDGRRWRWNTPAGGYRTTLLAGRVGTFKTRTGSDHFLSGRRHRQSRDEALHTRKHTARVKP